MSQEMNRQHLKGITLEGEAGTNMFSDKNMTLSLGITNRSEVRGELLITNPELLPLSDLTATYSKEDDVWTISGPVLDTPLRGSKEVKGPGFTLRIDGQAEAGDVFHLSTLTGAASGYAIFVKNPSSWRRHLEY